MRLPDLYRCLERKCRDKVKAATYHRQFGKRFVVFKSKRPTMLGLIAFVLLFGVALYWITNEARVQRETVMQVKRAGGVPLYDWEFEAYDGTHPIADRRSFLRRWLSNQLGDDYVSSVVYLWFREPVSESTMANVARLRHLEQLELDFSCIGDAEMAYLSGLKRLKVLNLARTNVTDTGLRHLWRLPELRELNLFQTPVTDAGREGLRSRLPHLNILPSD
jgi:Leucine rich repeat